LSLDVGKKLLVSVFVVILNIVVTTTALAETNKVESFTHEAEIFGLMVDDLSRQRLEQQLEKMGVNAFPSYREGIASYSLGAEGILGVRELKVRYNNSQYIEQINLSGVVESNEKRRSLGHLLVNKYGPPHLGFVNNGFGRAQWVFENGTAIELRNTTYDVVVVYIDRSPKQAAPKDSGRIDVQQLLRKSR